MHSPQACASSLFHVEATPTSIGNPIEPTPVKLLLIAAGPSKSSVATFPTESMAAV